MMRLGALLGLAAGLVEVLAVHGVAAWGGSGAALLRLLAIDSAVGALLGLGLGLALRLLAPRAVGRPRAQIGGILPVVLPLALVGMIVHGHFTMLQKLACMAACGLALVVYLLRMRALDRSERSRASRPEPVSTALPRGAAIALLAVFAATGLWAWRDGAKARPLGPLLAAPTFDSSTALPAASPLAADGTSRAPRLMVVGIDGGTWDIILPMIDRGELPHLRRLLEEGVGGILQSELDSFSPIVWTTIATGKRPAKHGLDDKIHVRSTDRRVKTLWQILGEAGLRNLVANVPGTSPAEQIEGALFAGFPLRGESFNNDGYVFSTRADLGWDSTAWLDHLGPHAITLDGGTNGRRGRFSLSERPTEPNVTATGELYRKAIGSGGWYPKLIERKYIEFEFELSDDGIRLSLDGPGDETVSLSPGEWTPWLVLDRPGAALSFRLRLLERSGDDVTLYMTPLFKADQRNRVRPNELGAEMDAQFGPYVVEGSGWLLFRVPQLLSSLGQHQFQIARHRRAAIEHVWNREHWDALFYVLTLTDRIQHPFWALTDPGRYPTIEDHQAYPYGEIPEGAEHFRDIVEQTYIWSDETLGRLLQKAGPNTIVAVVSDHGAQSGQHELAGAAGVHHPYGIYLFHGGPFRRDSAPELPRERIVHADPRLNGELLRIEDVTPTLLAALSLPLARDFDGGPSGLVLDAIRSAGNDVPLIATYEDATRAARSEERNDARDEAMMEQLRSLGYVN